GTAPGTYIRSILVNSQGLWIGTRANGLYISPDRKKFEKIQTSLKIKSVRGFFEHGKDLWICTDQGIIILKGQSYPEQQINVVPQRSNLESLSGPKVTAITRDRYGAVWVGTQESGLNKVIGFS